ncbi:MAG: TRAP transporter small permease [Candidatus Dadabacteria bacterium]|nr:MAG: TRAP transporter small permease [Candidatus Dadabacteria bacterium]
MRLAFVDRITAAANALSGACLAGMMLLTCADVIGRAAGRPILGAVEVTGMLAALTLAFSMPFAHQKRAHVGVELLVMRLAGRKRAALDLATAAVGTALFAVVGHEMWEYAGTMRRAGEVSMTLRIPTYPVIYLVAVAFYLFALVYALDAGDALGRMRRGGAEGQP